jgi:ribonuclease BN (tRNA processing enzyme)
MRMSPRKLLKAVTAVATAMLVGSGSTQPVTTSVSAHSTRLILLGTGGGPFLRLGRSEPSSLLVVEGALYMVDAGVGSLHNLVAAGFHAQDINAIFITHHHLDHDGGLADIIAYSSFGQRSQPVSITGPLGTRDMVRASLELLAPSRRIFAAEGLLKTPDPESIYKGDDIPQVVDPGTVYHDARVTVSAIENTHLRFIQPGSPSYGRDRSYGLRFQTPGGIVVFTGDSGPSQPLTKLAQGAEILVTEVINVRDAVSFATGKVVTDAASRARIAEHMEMEHLIPGEVGKMASSAGVKMVVLTHFSPGADEEHDTRPYVAGIRKFFHGPVVAGRDLDEIDLPF